MNDILIGIGTIFAIGLFVLFISKRRYFYGAISAIIGGILLLYMGFVIYFCREPAVGVNIKGLLFDNGNYSSSVFLLLYIWVIEFFLFYSVFICRTWSYCFVVNCSIERQKSQTPRFLRLK